MQNFLASWKTTLTGLASILLGILQASTDKDLTAMIHDPRLPVLFLIGVLGLVGKDGNVTGGQKGQPSTPAALIDANQAMSSINPPKS